MRHDPHKPESRNMKFKKPAHAGLHQRKRSTVSDVEANFPAAPFTEYIDFELSSSNNSG